MPLTSLHVTNAWHATSGGIRTFYSALLEAANREHRHVVVVAPAARDSVEPVGRFGRIHFVAAPSAPFFDRRYRMLYPYQYLPGFSGRVAQILEDVRPDLVEIADKYSLVYLAGVLRKRWLPRVPRPVLVGLSCERFDDNMSAYLSNSPLARRFTRWYLRRIYGPPFDVHVANSAYTAAELREAMPDRPASFIQVCPIGVDADGFGPRRRSQAVRAQLLRRTGGDRQTRLLLYAGRLSPEKNLSLLVETLEQLYASGDQDFRLVVAGDGPHAEWLRRQSLRESLRGRVVLLGNLDRESLASCYASCDVFVHPNPREPFGIGPLEAMASGVPVVAPNSGGVLTYANDGNAWLAEATAPAFAAAVRAAAQGDRVRVRAAEETAKAFRWEDATRRYFALYDHLYRDAHGRAPACHSVAGDASDTDEVGASKIVLIEEA